MIHFLAKICSFNFGKFDDDNEFIKYLRMGVIFALIIGAYWTLRPLKDSIFIQLVDKMQLPYAKTISVLALLPLVIIYTKLLEHNSRERMFVILPAFYGISVLLFGVCMFFAQAPADVIAARSMPLLIATQVLGYVWYFFVESFGSLAVALFWAFAADTTGPVSAKRGFPLVVAIGQMGGIIFPYNIAGLPHRLGLATDTLSMILLGVLILSIIPFVRYFIKATPAYLLESFHGKNEDALQSASTEVGTDSAQAAKKEEPSEPGFFEGLKILVSHNYLIGIFLVNFIYEFIITIFDFNFKVAASTQYSGVELTNYLSLYGTSVNVVSLLCLLLGISNVTRYLGLGTALLAMPVIVGFALFGFLTMDSLSFLCALMVGSKAINYALNGPALKQLYIPTTTDVRFKAQAWIETFGSRASKEAGSIFNMILKPMQTAFGEVIGKGHYLNLSGAIGFPLLILWFFIAMYLNKKYKAAIDEKNVVC